jgi:hypothetical protein
MKARQQAAQILDYRFVARAAFPRIASSAALLVIGMMALAAAACGSVGDACLFDSDCGGGSLCIREVCHAACSVEADCEPPYDQCLAFTRGDAGDNETVRICVTENFDVPDEQPGEDCKATGDCCTSDQECVELYDGDERARCGRDGRCLIPLP